MATLYIDKSHLRGTYAKCTERNICLTSVIDSCPSNFEDIGDFTCLYLRFLKEWLLQQEQRESAAIDDDLADARKRLHIDRKR